jgi:hypothetical protein
MLSQMVVHTYSPRKLSVLLHGQSHRNLHDEMIQSLDYQNKIITKRLGGGGGGRKFLEQIVSIRLLSHKWVQ